MCPCNTQQSSRPSQQQPFPFQHRQPSFQSRCRTHNNPAVLQTSPCPLHRLKKNTPSSPLAVTDIVPPPSMTTRDHTTEKTRPMDSRVAQFEDVNSDSSTAIPAHFKVITVDCGRVVVEAPAEKNDMCYVCGVNVPLDVMHKHYITIPQNNRTHVSE